jgi:hypothetical protein
MSKGMGAGKGKKKVRYHNPPNILREKCGYGGIAPDKLTQAQTFINENPLDFAPIAAAILKRLDAGIDDARRRKVYDRAAMSAISGPVMELKANGAMFGYHLISDVAAVLLNFLEIIGELNEDAVNIVVVHRQTLHVIVTNKLQGSGGGHGTALLQELCEACERYFKKYGIEEE